MGKNVFRMWSRETFLRVRMRFVECGDALMQILASLDWDKNFSVGVAGCSLVAMKREQGVTYGRTCVCYEDYQSSLRVRRDLWLGLFCFLLDDQLDLLVKETDRLYWCVRDFRLWQEGSEPKKFFFFCITLMGIFKKKFFT